jgi:hypothetical protein
MIMWNADTGRVVIDMAQKRAVVDGRAVDLEVFMKRAKSRLAGRLDAMTKVQKALAQQGDLLTIQVDGACVVRRDAKVTVWTDCMGLPKQIADVTDRGGVITATVRADRKRLVTATSSSLTLWDIAGRQELGTFGGLGTISGTAFRGDTLIVLSDRGLYELPLDERSVLRFACSLLRGRGQVPDLVGERLMSVQRDCLRFSQQPP